MKKILLLLCILSVALLSNAFSADIDGLFGKYFPENNQEDNARQAAPAAPGSDNADLSALSGYEFTCGGPLASQGENDTSYPLDKLALVLQYMAEHEGGEINFAVKKYPDGRIRVSIQGEDPKKGPFEGIIGLQTQGKKAWPVYAKGDKEYTNPVEIGLSCGMLLGMLPLAELMLPDTAASKNWD